MSDLLDLFREREALFEGHFLLSSGLHSPRYLQCARVLMDPVVATRLGALLAEKLRPLLPAAPAAVVAPALGGVLVAHEVARAFGCPGLFTERTPAPEPDGFTPAPEPDGGAGAEEPLRRSPRGTGDGFTPAPEPYGAMALRRGFTLAAGEPVVVVEDVITTGKSTREVLAALAPTGAKVIGVGSLVDRSGGTVDLGLPRASLLTLDVPSWSAEACPLCAQGGVPVKPGSRR